MRSICIIIFCVASLVVQSSNKPNIVLILIDDLGTTDLQAFGGEISTPNMDALAAEGMIFLTITPLRSVPLRGKLCC